MNRFTRPLFALIATLCLALPAMAASAPKAQTDHAALELLISAAPKDKMQWAAIEVTLEEDWHIYWQNPGDSGLEAQIKWTLPEGLTAGPIHWLAPHRIEYSGLFNYGYEGKTALLVPFKHDATPADDGAFTADIEFLICKDVCIPQAATLRAAAQPSSDERINAWRDKLPEAFKGRAEYDINGDDAYFAFDLTDTTIDLPRIYHAWWYPIDDQTISNASEQQWRLDDSTLILSVAREGNKTPAPFSGVLEVASTDGQHFHYHIEAKHTPAAGALPTDITSASEAATASGAPSAREMTLWLAIISAFLGGIVLNIMPCVLPVLSLKALSIAKKSGAERKQIRAQGLAYTAGIVLSFVAVAAALIALQQAGASIGWGFQLQEVGFVSALIYLLFVVGLNLSGAFDVPSSLAGIGSKAAQKDGLSGAFFTGILATIVATPCTAPFMAGAIGFALTQPSAVALIIFVALGLGLAFPFLLITFIPAATRHLPKPGAWMDTFKQLLAFPIYATVIWLLWVLVQQAGSMGLLHALVGMLIIAFALWLLGKCSNKLLQIGIVLAALYGLVLITDTAPEAAMPPAAHGAAQNFSQAALDHALADNKRVFVNATAAWCITCKVNERVALRDDAVIAALQGEDIVYLVADWTNRDTEIADYLASFGRSGVPMYVYYAPNQAPVLLPQLLTPSIILDQLNGDRKS